MLEQPLRGLLNCMVYVCWRYGFDPRYRSNEPVRMLGGIRVLNVQIRELNLCASHTSLAVYTNVFKEVCAFIVPVCTPMYAGPLYASPSGEERRLNAIVKKIKFFVIFHS